MAKIGIVHTDLTVFGGGDRVCLNVVETLQSRHDLELLTLTDPDFDALNRHFGTTASPIPVRRLSGVGRRLWNVGRYDLGLLATTMLCREVNRVADEYDLLFSTVSEFDLDGPSVQYVHFPRYLHRLTPSGPTGRVYERTCESLAGYTPAGVTERSRLLANSEYTRSVVNELYDAETSVVYPPVETDDVKSEPWTKRERGMVAVGSITPTKRQLLLIEVFRELRERGHDVHLHVVGGAGDRKYARRVRAKAAATDDVHLEGRVDRERLVRLLATHRYAIHGMPNEHFGIAVAEMVAAGCLPFVPDDGGQREIVNGAAELCYEDAPDAVRKIEAVLEREELADRLRSELPDVERRFGKDRFRREIESTVETALGELR